MFLISVALLAMGATKIYFWFNTREERRVGAALLAGGPGFALALAIAIRIQG